MSWPVRFILDSPAWQRGYDLAKSGREANPFPPMSQAWFGFEEGMCDLKRKDAGGA